MIGVASLALILLGQASTPTGRYDVGERLRDLDQAWMATPDKVRRTAAIPKITLAGTSFLASKMGEACRSLDEATAALLGRPINPEDAISLRFDPPFAEPRAPARLRIGWAYLPASSQPVRVQVGRQSVVATPGRELTIEVRPEQLNPEILQNPEVGYLMPVQVGAEQRSVFLSIIKKPKERLAALKATMQPEAHAIFEFLQGVFESPDSLEGEVPIIQYLFTAELLDEGRLRLDRADSLPMVKHNGTVFRAAFPRQVRGPLTVVIALHGAGGSENMFFEAYGRGRAVTEAVRRNWAFVAPRASSTAIQDVIHWMKTRRKQAIDRVFVMGHSAGGAFALQSGSLIPKPKGIAVFAPAAGNLPATLEGIPVLMTLGKQDAYSPGTRQLGPQIASRKGSVFEELDNCEHWMVVGESIPQAYRFFDQYAGR